MAKVQGYCDPAFEQIRQQMQDFLDSGEEVGTSFCVNIDGKTVIDLWGGYSDKDKSKPWNEDTIVNCWSTTKTVVALAALVLVDRGLLDLDERVAKYWPEFAQNGKQDVLVRHLLAHTAGLAAWSEPMSQKDLFNSDVNANMLARQAPLWEPGTQSGYHAITYGSPIGKLIKLQTGKSLTHFIAEELAAPLNADFQIGALEKDWPRVAEIIAPAVPATPTIKPGSIAWQAFTNPRTEQPMIRLCNLEGWRRAELGSSNGHSNARGVARILTPITMGGQANGHQLLSQKTIDRIFEVQANGKDLLLDDHTYCFGIGYGLVGHGASITDDFMPHGKVCFWGGWGGSLGIMDLDRKVTIGYVMNQMSASGIANKASRAYLKTLYSVIDAQQGKESRTRGPARI